MTGAIFTLTLRRNLRAMLYWGIGLFVIGLYVMIVIPDMDALKQMTGLLETLPQPLLQAFGMSDDAAFMATPDGFVSFGFFSRAVIILAIYGVIAGLGISSNEEDQGILDVVLSLPLPRWRLIVEKFLAYSIVVVGITLLMMAGLLVGTQASTLEFSLNRIVESALSTIPLTLLVMAITVCITSFVRRRGPAVAISAVVVAGSYLLNAIGSAAQESVAGLLGRISFFAYYDSNDVMLNGLSLLNPLILSAAAILLIVVSVWAFQRRDVGA